MAFRNFIYTEDDEDLLFLPKEPSPGLDTGSFSVLVNTKPLKADKVLVIQPAELTVSNKDEGLPDVLELKDATTCHLKISIITPPFWKNQLDNHMDLKLLDLHDLIEKLRGEFKVIKYRERARDEECEELHAKCEAAMAEFEKNPTIDSEVVRLQREPFNSGVKGYEGGGLKVIPYAAMELFHIDDMGSLVGRLVSSDIVYGRCRVFDQVAEMKEPFDLSNVEIYHFSYKKDHTQASNNLPTATFHLLDEFVADPLALIEALLSKKPPTLQRPSR
uniref:Uncharacterized protein n=1 Tax=Tanacetum cinerariifolium TaxID=118510 RepID=A0A699GJL0_TANCI|nr:hypothetical protein [Tanacetum cinerariifolium]